MKFLPTENIFYKTKLSPEEIRNRLLDSIEPERTLRINSFGNKYTKPYEGKFDLRSFNIRRIINYRNSFIPRIIGDFNQSLSGTVINVKMRLHNFVIIFLCLWSSIAVFFSFLTLSTNQDNVDFTVSSFAPIGMLLFVYILTMAAFKYESQKSKKDLLNLFEAEIIEE